MHIRHIRLSSRHGTFDAIHRDRDWSTYLTLHVRISHDPDLIIHENDFLDFNFMHLNITASS